MSNIANFSPRWSSSATSTSFSPQILLYFFSCICYCEMSWFLHYFCKSNIYIYYEDITVSYREYFHRMFHQSPGITFLLSDYQMKHFLLDRQGTYFLSNVYYFIRFFCSSPNFAVHFFCLTDCKMCSLLSFNFHLIMLSHAIVDLLIFKMSQWNCSSIDGISWNSFVLI